MHVHTNIHLDMIERTHIFVPTYVHQWVKELIESQLSGILVVSNLLGFLGFLSWGTITFVGYLMQKPTLRDCRNNIKPIAWIKGFISFKKVLIRKKTS